MGNFVGYQAVWFAVVASAGARPGRRSACAAAALFAAVQLALSRRARRSMCA